MVWGPKNCEKITQIGPKITKLGTKMYFKGHKMVYIGNKTYIKDAGLWNITRSSILFEVQKI
jgi:hypothetical protein